MSLRLVALILWNTNILFESLSLQERHENGAVGNGSKRVYSKILALSNLTFEVLAAIGKSIQ